MGDDAVQAGTQDGHLDDAIRKDAGEILAHAKWLLEQHDKRSELAQTRAAAVLAFTGSLLALAPRAVTQPAAIWQLILLGVVFIGGIGTGVQTLRILRPRTLKNGLPERPALRQLANKFDAGQPIVIPVCQFATDLLNAKDLGAASPIDEAADLAEFRVRALGHTYAWLAGTFLATGALTFLTAVHPS